MLKWWWLWRTVSPCPCAHSTCRLSSSSCGGRRTFSPRFHSLHSPTTAFSPPLLFSSSCRKLVGLLTTRALCGLFVPHRGLFIHVHKQEVAHPHAEVGSVFLTRWSGVPSLVLLMQRAGRETSRHEFLLCMRLAVDFTHVLGCFYSSHDFRMWL